MHKSNPVRSARGAVGIMVGVALLSAAGCQIVINPPAGGSDGGLCGGIAGVGCPSGQYCRFETGICGAGDQSGVCTDVPEACPAIYHAVCGCDGQTYGNECEAAGAGVSLEHDGECTVEGAVARVSGGA
jgi:hypothetical protein